MSQQFLQSVENNFVKGLITEASGLNFPESACTETYNCIFNLDGSVQRRLGLDYEEDYSTKTIDRTDVAISTYLWKNVSGDGSVTLFVAQIGGTVYFWETGGDSVSEGAISSTITLSTYKASGAPDVTPIECQFSSGNQYLIVTHPYCTPFYVSYDTSTQTATGTAITLQIRDFEGDTADTYDVDERPTSTLAALDVNHHYNLLNQGWTTANLTTWDSGQTTMPSNSDVMWRFKDTNDAFSAGATAVAAVFAQGNSPAPKGHYILTVWDKDRDTASGLTGTTTSTTSYQRPSTSAWYAGRVFYSGLNYMGYTAKIFFTKIIESDDDYGKCHQVNDPTAENLFDLLPSDGGVIEIHEAGIIYKIVAVPSGLIIFANNGIWSITGSTGLGFRANDYTLQKISSINAISASSFVDVGGTPAWWNSEGIYILSGEGGSPVPKDLTRTTIKSFFDDIPNDSKLTAKGFFNTVTGVIQWIYRSTEGATPTETYTYDRILNFNLLTGAFYPWSMGTADVGVNGIVVLEGSHGNVITYDIVDDTPDNIVDDSANQIISFEFAATSGGFVPTFKYLISSDNGAGSYDFTFGETNNSDYVDWFSLDATGSDFESYFITGYKLRGTGLRKFYSNWVTLYTHTASHSGIHTSDNDNKYYFRAIWDYANTEDTNRWSTNSLISISDTDYNLIAKKLKIRGHGRSLQFKVSSYTGSPFHIVGWAALDAVNQLP